MKVKITRGKFEGINACADKRGVIAALAVDHRGISCRRLPGHAVKKALLLLPTCLRSKQRSPKL